MNIAKICITLHVLCAMIFTAALGVTAVAAETQSNPPMDVVLVMDSSGSMKDNDPEQLRKPAAKLFISLLSPQDRAGVVSFSDKGYPVAFLTPLDSTKNKDRLFAAVDKISTRGFFTNLHGAMHGAQRVFNRSLKPERKKVVILMSDGKMDLGESAKTKELSRKLKEEMLPWLVENNIEVQTIAFTEHSPTELLKSIASATDAGFHIAKSDKELHRVFSTIFEQNKSPNMIPFDGEKFKIDSAIQEVTIVGSKDNPDVVLTLLTPSSTQINEADKPANISWFVSNQFDIITIKKPENGQWQIKASSGKNKAYVVTDLQLKLSIEPETPNVGEGVFIRTWLEDNGKIINKESIITTITPELSITTPEGENHVLALDIEADEQDETKASGVFFSHIAFPSAGKHDIRVSMDGNTFKRERHTILETVDPNGQPHTDTAEHVEQQDMQPGHEHVAQEENTSPPQEDHGMEQHTENTQIDITPPLPAIDAHITEPAATEHDPHHHDDEGSGHDDHKDSPVEEDKKHNHDKPSSDKEKSGSSGIIVAIYIFLGINAVLLLGGGVAYFFIKKRKKKASSADTPNNKKAEPTIDDEDKQEKAA